MIRVSLIYQGHAHRVSMSETIATDLWSAWWALHAQNSTHNLFSGAEGPYRFSYRLDQIIAIEMNPVDPEEEKDRARIREINQQQLDYLKRSGKLLPKKEPWEDSLDEGDDDDA